MRMTEVWKYIGVAGIFMLFLLLAYPVLAGMSVSLASREAIAKRAFSDAETLLAAVESTGASIREVQIRYKQVGLRFQDEQDVELFLQAIARQVGLVSWREEQRDDGVRIYRGERKSNEDIELIAYVSVYVSAQGKDMHGNLGLTFRGKENQVRVMKHMIAEYMQIPANSSELPQIISCVRGIYNGKLENDLQKKKVRQILAFLDGTMVESLEEETVLSYSVYSPLFNTAIKTNHRSMNLQVATHYDKNNQETMIIAGIPIITVEY
ncbi:MULTISPECIES: YwmB family TATA-box binding protein [Aneurinibacillus]|uniref:TATA-box binding n=1 Tax=Aneurinibacillus thermoaerophilus TaxID=143495 RepID=A0A1G8A004_ANETH|nr:MULTISPECIES: YwmB family TATA-box binding protein [Aneurinibacillus]AMA71656.1 hypothetical protein ACH33_01595 [Aneurinibacillus sp. XH2]MED0676104.1 YwmB family TATA-box binding protein [Aneurinibacillus thermoaerophilus]MED0680796.1 YwmB family TATA-box binding protein [Aneurinibacillus thermoaerophilus]MED0738369.1 YwmB family TATA-box binding protein [Aneurinibacillus thermoaerophilus]MED0757641.1 YwmB family TATA-box binding protein [Aneurinibacillus thermoaerophilus]